MSSKSLRNLDLNLMVVFEAIYDSGNISQAALRLSMTQPAVSNALKRLRDLMGDPLFVKAKRGVEPTLKARRMIRPVRDALRLIGGQIDRDGIDPATYQRHFRILLNDPIEAVVMPSLVRTAMQQMPGVTFETLTGFRSEFVQEIIEGVLDVALYIFPVAQPDIVSEPIGTIDAVLVARRGHPAFAKPITAEGLGKLGHVVLVPEMRSYVQVEQSLAAQRSIRHAVHTVSKLWAFPIMIERTDLVGILPRWFVAEISRNFDIETHESPVPINQQHIYLTWHARNTNDPGHRWLRETILNTFRNKLGAVAPTPLKAVRGTERA